MRYIFVAGRKEDVMHIQKHTVSGTQLMEALCDIDEPFDRTINAPFALGRKVCGVCLKIAEQI